MSTNRRRFPSGAVGGVDPHEADPHAGVAPAFLRVLDGVELEEDEDMVRVVDTAEYVRFIVTIKLPKPR